MSTFVWNICQLFKCSVWTIQVLKDWRFLRMLSASTYGDSTQSVGPQRECRDLKNIRGMQLPAVEYFGNHLSLPSGPSHFLKVEGFRILQCSKIETAGNPPWNLFMKSRSGRESNMTKIYKKYWHRVGFDPHVLVGNTEKTWFFNII